MSNNLSKKYKKLTNKWWELNNKHKSWCKKLYKPEKIK